MAPCNFCSSASVCTSCISYYYLTAPTCSPCISHCVTCPDSSTCSTCETNYVVDTFINNNNKCVCVLNMYMYQGNCIVNCPSPFYGEPSTRACTLCPTECSKCNSPIDCTECASGYAPTPKNGKCVCIQGQYFIQGTINCVSACPYNFYGNTLTGYCESCDPKCKVCSSPADTTCSVCNNGNYLTGTTCSPTCAVGFYGNTNDNQCKKCVEPCTTCTHELPVGTSCTGCMPTYYLSANTCLPCVANCNTCSVNGLAPLCDTAPDGCALYRKNNGAGNCICDTNLFLYLGNCVSTCPNPYWQNSANNQCVQCDA